MNKRQGFYVDPTARLNVHPRLLQGCIPSMQRTAYDEIQLPSRVWIGAFVSVGLGVRLGEEVIVDNYCSIDTDVSVGDRTLITYRASIGSGSKIGMDCVIGGSVPENCTIGNRCRVFGSIIHTHDDPTMSWDHHEVPEISPRILDDTFIGFGALVIGDIGLGPIAYVCAGATVTRTVPPRHVAFGINRIIRYDMWKGRLSKSPLFNLPLEQ